jgi:transposase
MKDTLFIFCAKLCISNQRRISGLTCLPVTHSLLVIIYHVLREKKAYTDLGADYFDKLDTARIERDHVRRLEQLGYMVTLTPAHAA